MLAKFFGGLIAAVGVVMVLAFPVLLFLGIWETGDIVHKYVGTAFLSLFLGGCFFGLGMLLAEDP